VESFRHDGLDLNYEVLGSGPDLVLLHPFPSCHEFWLPVSQTLAQRYRVILPDLRAHGRSGLPNGRALMGDHARDVDALCRQLEIGRAIFGGISIGGYILFEFWRRFPERVRALAMFCTKAAADTAEARAHRLQSAEQVLEHGVPQFIDGLMPKLLGETTRRNRQDIVNAACHTMRFATPQGLAAVQRGMAARPDSTATLATISVPTLFVAGEEDGFSGPSEMRSMSQTVKGSQFVAVPRVGHYAAFEAPDECARVLRKFCDSVPNH
jgi:pimeloyl-ACP methyl ester carboxylesterase